MCRLVAYMGPRKTLSAIVIEPSHSLVAQSLEAREGKLSVNGDGVGIAWYGTQKEPGLYKDIGPAWSDHNLLSLCQHLRSPLFLAHVRASTEGETSRANCHPFTYENWSFMHNGQIASFASLRRALEATLSDDLYAARRGSTDSELLFLLLLNAGLSINPEVAYQRVIEQLYHTASAANVAAFFRLTCVFSDGSNLYCFRHASDNRCPTLYASKRIAENGLVLASEPIDNEAKNWSTIPCNRIIRFGIDSTVALEDISRSGD